MDQKFRYLLHLADNALILSHRLSEWCGHGPVLEQDIALTNIALDLLGQARLLYQYAAELEGKGRTENDLAYLRTERQYYNCLLVEQPNGHWGTTIMRQFLYDTYNHQLYTDLTQCPDERLAAIAYKSIKEIAYHREFSTDWLYRLSGGTQVSHQKMTEALDDLYHYTGELVEPFSLEKFMMEENVIYRSDNVPESYYQEIHEGLERAGLKIPLDRPMQSGGREGLHTEHMGFILAEHQYMQRTYPNMEW
jgi:ring-1,2-phenylacetyl-CoA epoxidase subunit PaaC